MTLKDANAVDQPAVPVDRPQIIDRSVAAIRSVSVELSNSVDRLNFGERPAPSLMSARRHSHTPVRTLDATSHVVIVETDDASDSETNLTPKTMRRYMETISDSDIDASDDDDFQFPETRSNHSVGGSSTSTRRSSVVAVSERSQSITGDKLSPQEARFIEQMRLLRKFVRERNNLIAGREGDDDRSQFVPPDGGWGWMVVLGGALVFFFAGGLSRCFTLIYLQFLQVFNQSAAATSATAAIFGAVKMCTSPLVAMMCARYSKRSVALCGGLVTSLSMIATSYPVSLEYVYISYGICAAFGINMVLTPCFVIIGEYFKKRRARAMSIAMLGGSLGGMALPPLVNYLFDIYGYSGAMLIYSGIMLNICIAGIVFRPVKLRSRAEVEKEKELKRMKKEAKKKEKECNCQGNGHVANGNRKMSNLSGATEMSNSTFGNHRDSVCSVCDHEEEVDDGPPPDFESYDDLSSSISSLHNFKDEVIKFGQKDEKEGSGSLHTADGESKVMFSKPDESPIPTRKRRVSFQVSTVTKLIPAYSYDGDNDDDESDSEPKKENPCMKKLASFSRSFGFHLFRKPRFLFYSLLMMASIMSLSISGTFLSGLVSDLNMDKSHTSIMLSASAILDVPSKFASGFIFDMKKIRPYRSLPLAFLGFITGAFALGIGFSQDYKQLFISFMIYNFFASAYHTQHATVLADLVGAENLSSAMGLCRLCQGIGICLGPTIGGHLKDITGRYQNAYVFSGAVLLTATLVYTTVDQWFLWRQRRIERAAYFPKGHYARYRSDSIAVT